MCPRSEYGEYERFGFRKHGPFKSAANYGIQIFPKMAPNVVITFLITYGKHIHKYKHINHIFRKITVWALDVQMLKKKVYFDETGFGSETDLIFVWYSIT
jgi:hypothetical protein